MQNTTADYKLEINKPSRSFECKITIGNNIYTNEDLVNLTLEYTQPQEGFAIGNTISQSLDLTLLNRGDIIYSTSQIKVEIGLKIAAKIEYILMGIFNIDDIEKTDYTTKFTAYDNMIKFETDYFSELGDKPTLKQVVNELSSKTGVEFTGSLPDYNVSKLEGFSCREVLSYVASICGGNAFITRDGKFTIKSLSEVEKSIDGNNYFDYTREEVKYKVGQISCQVDENNILSKGSTGTDSMELGFENPWISETILTEIYNKLKSVEYLGYSMKWQGDISLDPYDIITVTDIKNVVRKIPILSQKLSYTGGLTSEIGAKGETKNKNSFSSSGSTTNKVNRAVIEQAIIKEALIGKANIEDVEAVSIRTQTLEAKTAKIEDAIIDVAHIKDLNAINANIQNLIAADATINNALIGKADITELNAVKGTINSLDSKIANIETLVNGNLSSENIQAGGITSDKLTIANGFITNAMIASLDVAKINAGDISTNKFRIVSDNGGIEIVGATQQFKDKNNKVRIQMGQDATGNFNFILRGEDGTTTLIDHTGIKEKAIADNLIKENMVAADAIGEKQINYSSLITGLNKDTNTQLIKASKVAIDLTGQSLEVAFNSLKSNVDNMQIGGRNIIRKDINNISKWSLNYPERFSISNVEYDNTLIYKTTGGGWETAISDGIAVIPNKEYVLSFEYEVFNKYSYLSGETFRVEVLSERIIGNSSKYKAIAFHTIENVVTPRKRVYITFTPIISTIYLMINGGYIADGLQNLKFSFNKFKLETGNKATDWIPAPEDIDSKIESNSTTINVMQGQITTAINNTQIVKDGQTILLKDDYNRTVATVNSINSTIGTHTTKINELTGSITSVDTKVNSVQRDLEGTKSTVSSHTSQINGLNSTVSTQGASISQLQNQIKLKVEATDIATAINNMQIGGRNLFLNSGFTKGLNYWNTYNCSSPQAIADNSALSGYAVKFTSTGGGIYQRKGGASNNPTNYPNGSVMTVSGYVKSSVANKMLRPNFENAGANTSKAVTCINANTWYYFTHTYTINSLGFSTVTFYGDSGADYYLKDVILEYGNKATTWTPAPEDIDSSIANVQTQVTTTSNKVATIETNLSSITSRVSSTESTVNTINGNITSLQNRMSSAEQQITSSAIINTVQCTINAAKNEAINSANSSTDNKLKSYATTSSLTQTANNITAKFEASGGYNLLQNSGFKTGDISRWWIHQHNSPTGSYGILNSSATWGFPDSSVNCCQIRMTNQSGKEYGIAQTFSTTIGKKYTISLYYAGHRVSAANIIVRNSNGEWVASKSFNPSAKIGGNSNISNWGSISLTFTATQSSHTINLVLNSAENDGYFWIAKPQIVEGEVALPYSPHPSEIYSASTVIDSTGVTVNNGALTVKNNAGATVLNSDTNGNLIIAGEIRSQYGQQWVGLNSGGLTFQDSQRNEQMLRVGLAYYEANRDMNGIEFAMPQYSDFIRFSHISKADLNNGWSSSDTSYNFFELWSGTNTFGGSTRNKGMTVNAPLYIKNSLKFYSGTNHFSEINRYVSWSNASGTISNMLGVYGDNGSVLGYKSGENLTARIIVTEEAHPGTGDNIISWGNYNFNGYTFHNANIVAKSLSVSGSKNCLQETLSYGSRLINAYETAEYYFGDLGFARINEDGECLVSIDDTFLECVNTNAAYHVFTQIYNGSIKTIERYKTYFIVKGDPGTSFSWELKAKRIGYENNRLDTQEIESQDGNKIDLFGDGDFKVETSEDTLMDVLTFELEDLLLMEG